MKLSTMLFANRGILFKIKEIPIPPFLHFPLSKFRSTFLLHEGESFGSRPIDRILQLLERQEDEDRSRL